jgi:hypothetical protein
VQFFDKCVQAEDAIHGLVIEEAPHDPRLLTIGRARMFTYYPITDGSRRLRRLRTLSEHFGVAGLHVPFWPVLQAFGRDLVTGPVKYDLRVPTRDELQFTLCSALADGAQGIFFYPYVHPTIYDAAKAANGKFAYGSYRPLPEIAPQLWSAVLECGALANQVLGLVRDGTRKHDLLVPDLPGDMTLAQWETSRGTLVLLANTSYDRRSVMLHAPRVPLRVQFLQDSTNRAPRMVVDGSVRVDVPGPGGVALILEPAP